MAIITPILAMSLLTASLPILIDMYATRYREEDKKLAFPDYPPNLNLPVKETFDFIIIGAGTAGCVLARRIADAGHTVLLLEAGGNPPPLESVPSLSQPLKWIPSIHYIYGSTQEVNAARGNGGIIPASAGKMMGGSSSHNSGHFVRGSPFDYDNYAQITGDVSWKYENVLKYFLKLENYNGIWPTDNGQHGKSGLINLVNPNLTFRSDIWFSAGKNLGFDTNDPNGPEKQGFSPVDYAFRNGRRESSYSAYVQPVEKSLENFVIRRYSVVSEILFDNTSTAIGVLYERHGVPSAAFVSKEVILSAGAYISPILLIKSGIGPISQLNAAKKNPLAILPVGENMQDHPMVHMPSIEVTDNSIFLSDSVTFEDFSRYIKTGNGSVNFNCFDQAFITSTREVNRDWPDIHLYLLQNTVPGDRHKLGCLATLARPRSRGTITYNATAQTLEQSLLPIINYNFFDDPHDIEVMLESMGYCEQLVYNTTTFKKLGAKFDYTTSLPCSVTFGGDSTSQRAGKLCYMKENSDSDWHMTSTVPMGRNQGDPRAVLDSKFRVLGGVKGLRVVDGSVFPTIPNANSMGPILMIAEKAAAEILETWRNEELQRL